MHDADALRGATDRLVPQDCPPHVLEPNLDGAGVLDFLRLLGPHRRVVPVDDGPEEPAHIVVAWRGALMPGSRHYNAISTVMHTDEPGEHFTHTNEKKSGATFVSRAEPFGEVQGVSHRQGMLPSALPICKDIARIFFLLLDLLQGIQ